MAKLPYEGLDMIMGTLRDLLNLSSSGELIFDEGEKESEFALDGMGMRAELKVVRKGFEDEDNYSVTVQARVIKK